MEMKSTNELIQYILLTPTVHFKCSKTEERQQCQTYQPQGGQLEQAYQGVEDHQWDESYQQLGDCQRDQAHQEPEGRQQGKTYHQRDQKYQEPKATSTDQAE